MVQRAFRAGETPPSATWSSAEETAELGRDWVVLRHCRLGRPVRGGEWPTVLLHPARGAAVLDILPSDTPDAAEALRARLDAARFPVIFAGHLPIVRLRVAPRQVPLLPSLLDDAFAAEPPLRLPGGDAWVGVATRALMAEQPVFRFEASRPLAEDAAVGPMRRPARRRRAAAFRRAGAVLLCLAALGGAVGLALNKAPPPAPEAAPAAPAAVVAAPAAGEAAPPRASVPPALPPAAPAAVPAAPLPAPASRDEAAATVQPVPQALPPPVAVDVPPLPPLLRPAAPPSPPRSRRPEAAAPPPSSSQQPTATRAPERPAPRRQQGEEAGAARSAPNGAGAAPRTPETPPDRCRRVSGLVGSGTPLSEADMRFFNTNCIRW